MKIKVKLHPSSSQEKVTQISENEFEIWIKEKPIDNKANKALEKLIKKHLNKNFKIIKGHSSKIKILESK